MDKVFKDAENKMEKRKQLLIKEFASIRAGRANPGVLDKIMVNYYDTPTAINQLAAISVTEARTLTIQPWDISVIKMIEKAIQSSDLGINPQTDGKVIRLIFPPITEDRRRDIVRDINKMAEEAKISIRTIRRNMLETLKVMKKKSEITEDDLKDAEKRAQKMTDKLIEEIEHIAKGKDKEIMEL